MGNQKNEHCDKLSKFILCSCSLKVNFLRSKIKMKKCGHQVKFKQFGYLVKNQRFSEVVDRKVKINKCGHQEKNQLLWLPSKF